MTENVEWRYTFPIEKAENRDGRLFLTGLASGPEVDAQGERMDPGVIFKFADQINVRSKEDRLVYRDAHAPDGVLRDLGWLEKGWVNDQNQLGVEVELDVANPAAIYLYKNITERGKKYGMSVAGEVHAKADEFLADIGKAVRTLKDVVLTEISNTTRPAWTPSFGSVISKAITDAAKADENATGEKPVSEKETELHQHDKPADATPEQPTEAADDSAAVVETTTTETATTVEAPAEGAEKAGKKVSNATASKLIEQYQSLGATLRELGVLEDSEPTAEKADSEDAAVTAGAGEGSESEDVTKALADAISELSKSQAELNAKLEKALTRPITMVPPVMEKNASEQFEETFKGLDPSARLRVAMAAQTGGK